MRLSDGERTKRQNEISYRIKDVMNRRNMTQAKLATSSGVSTGSMSQKMNNPGLFRVDELFAIANILNVSFEWLMGAEK